MGGALVDHVLGPQDVGPDRLDEVEVVLEQRHMLERGRVQDDLGFDAQEDVAHGVEVADVAEDRDGVGALRGQGGLDLVQVELAELDQRQAGWLRRGDLAG